MEVLDCGTAKSTRAGSAHPDGGDLRNHHLGDVLHVKSPEVFKPQSPTLNKSSAHVPASNCEASGLDRDKSQDAREATIRSMDSLVGGTCAFRPEDPVSSRNDLMAAAATTWALILSYQTDCLNPVFDVNTSGKMFEPHGVCLCVDRHRSVSDAYSNFALPVGRSVDLSHDINNDPASRWDAARLNTMLDFGNSGLADVECKLARYHITLKCTILEAETKVCLSAVFDPRHMSRELVQCLLSDFEHVMWQLLQPGATNLRLGDLETTGPITQRAMVRLNRPLPPKSHTLFHHQIATQAKEHPTAPAVVAWDGAWSYDELNTLSDWLSGHLVALGVGPESLVPVLLEKSKLRIVAMLAVVKAGGAIVTMDPRAPRSRLRDMAAAASSSIAICSIGQQGKLASVVQEVILDAAMLTRFSSYRQAEQAPLSTTTSPDNALYVTFTSGSSGRPKGVVITHAAFISSVNGFKDPIRLSGPGRRVLHYASPSFDASILEIFATLMVGGCICIPSESDCLDNIAKCINDFHVNWAILTPQVAKLLQPEEVPRLEVLCLGGETFPRELASVWAGHVTLFNAYGPTEASILCVSSDPIRAGQTDIPLGKARNCAVWIVNESGDKLQSFNTIGEIVLEGEGIARGYLQDEANTRAAFGEGANFLDTVAASSKFYRTGDLGRMSVDGTIEFFGRRDGQEKLNGQRIELGEVEHHVRAALLRDDATSSFDVVVEAIRLSGRDKPVLAAFIGPMQGPRSEESFLDLRHGACVDIQEKVSHLEWTLSETIPQYMVPKLVLPCRSIPLLPSGKADRKRLRQAACGLSQEDLAILQGTCKDLYGMVDERDAVRPLNDATVSTADTSASRGIVSSPNSVDGPFLESSLGSACGANLPANTITTKLLRSIWADILSLPEASVSREHDFMKLGGDSIGLIRIIAACRQHGFRATVMDLASNTVLKDMIQVCRRIGDDVNDASEVRLRPFELLDSRMAAQLREEAAIQCAVRPGQIEDMYPCTHIQEDMMAANMIHHGLSVGRFIHKLPQNIDITKFQRAWELAWMHTPILRTRFVSTIGAGSLQVVSNGPIPWSRAHGLGRYLETDKASPMLPGSCLARFAVVVETNKTVYFVWTMHHMLYDGWSIPLVRQRVNAIYHGVELEPPVDFRKFVVFTRTQDTDLSRSYWGRTLRDVATSAFPAPASQHVCLAQARYKAHLELPISIPLFRSAGLTLTTVVQAAWAIIIGHYSNTEDVVFGATVSGRNASLADIDRIDGPTLATVPVRVTLKPQCPVIQILRSVQAYMNALVPHQHLGLKAIREISEHTRRGCDFQTVLIVQPDAAWDVDDHPLGMPLHEGEDAAVPLLCQVWLHPGRLQFHVAFDDSVVSREEVSRIIDHVQLVILQLLQLPESSTAVLRHIRLGKEMAVDHVVRRPQVTESLEAIDATIHDLVYAMIERQGHEEAVCSSNNSLSYQSLGQISSRLATHLLSIGVSKGTIMPLYFEKSVWAVVSMLAVLQTGAAFVLLDPSQPVHRVRQILGQIDAKYIITHDGAMLANLGLPMKHVTVTPDSLEAMPWGRLDRLPVVSPADMAFMIFTSGSTGQPKGVMISHSALASSAMAYAEALGLEPRRRVLQFSSYCFDASINETLVVLLRGGTVCVASDRERVEDLVGYMRQAKVNWAILTPSVARVLSPVDVPDLETLDLGGEAPDEALLSLWHRAGVRVFNVYGPAEGAGTAFCHRYSEGVDPRTIGFPMGCRAWIADADDHETLVADGQLGELLLEGPILASGYYKDHGKTDQSFVLNPGWARPTSSSPRRLYKTGDLCFRSADGAVTYFGRKDLQVKVHGQRIELGDIEAHLVTCNPIQRCAVFYPESGPLKHELTAVIELATPSTARPSVAMSLKRQLATKVPAAMVPSRWVNVIALFDNEVSFPLNASGKVDRRLIMSRLEGLSEDQVDAYTVSDFHRPLDESATGQICPSEQPAHRLGEAIYAMIRGRKSTSLERICEESQQQHFDDLVLQSSGLDSLDMMSLVYLISAQFGVSVSMQLLLDPETTIRKLAAVISSSSPSQTAQVADDQLQKTPDRVSVNVMEEIHKHDSCVLAHQPKHLGYLDFEIKKTVEDPARASGQSTVLLTGATGYVGTQILRQLLEHDLVGKVLAVVRGDGNSAAIDRTIESATRAGWWTPFHNEKLEVWCGDLSRPRLGLNLQRWKRLESGIVDAIIHNGAIVHWAKSYAALETVNVESTVQLLTLAVRIPHVQFVYVSGGRERGHVDEREEEVAEELSAPETVGYSQSKFIAEAVVKRAARRCFGASGTNQFSIISPGLVIGTPTEGIANCDDYIWRLAAASISIGAYNAEQRDTWIDVCDVGTLASVTIDAGLRKSCEGAGSLSVKNVTDGMTWGDFWDILTTVGYQLKPIGASEWLAAVRDGMDLWRESHPLWPLAHLLGNELVTQSRCERGKTSLRLKVALRKTVEFLAEVGFLPPSQMQAEGAAGPKQGCFTRSGTKG